MVMHRQETAVDLLCLDFGEEDESQSNFGSDAGAALVFAKGYDVGWKKGGRKE